MKKKKSATLTMTDEQREQMKPLFDLVDKDYRKGKPGAIFCQVYEHGKIEVRYLDNEAAEKVIDALLEGKAL